MSKPYTKLALAIATAALAIVGPISAQTEPEKEPTAKDPVRFTAFAIQMTAGASGTVQIAIERWTTDAERQALLAEVSQATDKPGGQDKLLGALQNIQPRVGFIRTGNSLGWDLKYAWRNTLPDGGQQIVIATDKPVSFFAAANNTRSMDYPFTLIDMRFPKGSETGEGKLLGGSSISTKNGKLEIELYGQQPTRLNKITRQKQ